MFGTCQRTGITFRYGDDQIEFLKIGYIAKPLKVLIFRQFFKILKNDTKDSDKERLKSDLITCGNLNKTKA